jgi:hypothetical protein
MHLSSQIKDRLIPVAGTEQPKWKVPEFALAVTQFEGAYWVEIASGDNPLIGWAEYSIMIDAAEEDVGMLIEMLDEDARRAKHWIVSDAHDGRLGDIDRLNELDSISLPGGVPYEIYLNNSGKLAKDHIKGQALSETVTAEIEAHKKARFGLGVIGKGLAPELGRSQSSPAMDAYGYALAYAINEWIKSGGIYTALEIRRPGSRR